MWILQYYNIQGRKLSGFHPQIGTFTNCILKICMQCKKGANTYDFSLYNILQQLARAKLSQFKMVLVYTKKNIIFHLSFEKISISIVQKQVEVEFTCHSCNNFFVNYIFLSVASSTIIIIKKCLQKCTRILFLELELKDNILVEFKLYT